MPAIEKITCTELNNPYIEGFMMSDSSPVQQMGMNSAGTYDKPSCFVCNGRRGPWRSFAEKESHHSNLGIAPLLQKILSECSETAPILTALPTPAPAPDNLLCGSCYRLVLEADRLQVDLEKTKKSICVRFCTRNGPVSSTEELVVGDIRVRRRSDEPGTSGEENGPSSAKKRKDGVVTRGRKTKKQEPSVTTVTQDVELTNDATVTMPGASNSEEGENQDPSSRAEPESTSGEYLQHVEETNSSAYDNFEDDLEEVAEVYDEEDINWDNHSNDPDFSLSKNTKSRSPKVSNAENGVQKRVKKTKSELNRSAVGKLPKGESQVCEECGLNGTHEMLELHRNLVHGAKTGSFPCELCPVMLRSEESLEAHMKRNHSAQESEKVFVCEHCGRKCRTEYERKHHQDVVHGGECKYECSECGERFRYKPVLRNHLLKVHGIDKRSGLPCNVCGKMFYGAWKSQMFTFHMKDAHQIEVPALKTWRCKTCGKEFQFQSRLINHERLHTGEKPHSCTHCGKTFRLQQKLSIHVSRMHSGKEKPPREQKKPTKNLQRIVIGGENSSKMTSNVDHLLADMSTGQIVVDVKKEENVLLEDVHLPMHHVVTNMDGNLVLQDIQHLQDLHHIVVQPVEDQTDETYMMQIKDEAGTSSSIPVSVADCVNLQNQDVVVTQDANGKRISFSKAIWSGPLKQIPMMNGTPSLVVLKMDGAPVDASVTLYSDFDGTGELSDGSNLHYEI